MVERSKLRLGVLGAANIARQFAAGCARARNAEIRAVASRDLDRAARFAKDIGAPRALGSYEALLDDPDLDAIYIPLPNAMHAPWAIRALEAGKHVLCEKPLAMNAGEARAIFAAAAAHGRIVREAYPYLAQEQTAILRRWLTQGAIGRINLARVGFSVFFADPANIRLDAALGGGALYDAGSYALSLLRIAMGRCATQAQAVARLDENGVDRTTLATLRFGDGALAQMSCSFESAYLRHASFGGDAGCIETNYLNHPPISGPALLRIRRGRALNAPFEAADVPDGDGFMLEIDSFAALARGEADAWTGATPQESVDIAAMMDAIRASAAADGAWVAVSESGASGAWTSD